MWRPSRNSPTENIYIFGLHHRVVLKHYPESNPLVEPFTEINDALMSTKQDKLELEMAMAPLRAMVHITDLEVDDEVRLLAKTAEMADGGRRGAIFEELFPGGISPVIVPVGAREVTFLTKLTERVKTSNKAAELRAEWEPRIARATERYQGVLAARADGLEKLTRARIAEELARETWFDAIERHQGFIMMTFPRDRRKQDVFFPPSQRSHAAQAEEETETLPEGEEHS